MVLEQLSEQRERAKLMDLKEKYDKGELSDADLAALPPYGEIVQTLVIRDLSGIGMDHMGSQGRDIIKKVVAVSADNYPEMMNKCYMINTPFMFNTIWYFIKGLLAQRTVDKVSMSGSKYLDELSKRVAVDNIPDIVKGGKLADDLTVYSFDTAPGGCLGNYGAIVPEPASETTEPSVTTSAEEIISSDVSELKIEESSLA